MHICTLTMHVCPAHEVMPTIFIKASCGTTTNARTISHAWSWAKTGKTGPVRALRMHRPQDRHGGAGRHRQHPQDRQDGRAEVVRPQLVLRVRGGVRRPRLARGVRKEIFFTSSFRAVMVTQRTPVGHRGAKLTRLTLCGSAYKKL